MSHKKAHEDICEVATQGDLVPHGTPHFDVRNDFAGSLEHQIKGLILRYLENLPAEDLVDVAGMASQMQKHYPMQTVPVEDFQKALKDLASEGWVHLDKDEVAINKTARVAHAYLFSHYSK